MCDMFGCVIVSQVRLDTRPTATHGCQLLLQGGADRKGRAVGRGGRRVNKKDALADMDGTQVREGGGGVVRQKKRKGMEFPLILAPVRRARLSGRWRRDFHARLLPLRTK